MKMKNTKPKTTRTPRKKLSLHEKAIQLILTGCEAFGWTVIVPRTKTEESPIPYLLIGNPDAVKQVTHHLEKTQFRLIENEETPAPVATEEP